MTKTILVAGTYDTKDDELSYLAGVIRDQGGAVCTMDVSVLGDPSRPADVSKHDVAAAGGSSIQEAIDSGDENHAMQIMARGAAAKASELYRDGQGPWHLRLEAAELFRQQWLPLRHSGAFHRKYFLHSMPL